MRAPEYSVVPPSAILKVPSAWISSVYLPGAAVSADGSIEGGSTSEMEFHVPSQEPGMLVSESVGVLGTWVAGVVCSGAG